MTPTIPSRKHKTVGELSNSDLRALALRGWSSTEKALAQAVKDEIDWREGLGLEFPEGEIGEKSCF